MPASQLPLSKLRVCSGLIAVTIMDHYYYGVVLLVAYDAQYF